jgi:hypothetical protein
MPQLGVCMRIEGGEAIPPRDEDIGLPVVFNEQRGRMISCHHFFLTS